MVRELTKLSSELDSAFDDVTAFLDSLVGIDSDTDKTVDLIKKDGDDDRINYAKCVLGHHS